MSDWDAAPDSIVIDFLTSAGTPVMLAALGESFLEAMNLKNVPSDKPFRVQVLKKKSTADNAYYDYSQNNVALPDGLQTLIRAEGVVLPMGSTKPSKSGLPTRTGKATIMVGTQQYNVTAYITKSRRPYYIKVVANKKAVARAVTA